MKDIPLIFFSLGLLFLSLSVIIWKFKYINIISGLKSEDIKDKNGLAKWIGKIMLIISIFAFCLGFLNHIISSEKILLSSLLAFMISTMILAALILAGIEKFK